MLKSAHDQSLYCDHLDRIVDPGAIDAFWYLVGWASSLRGYECFPAKKGVIHDFRWMFGEEQHFALIPNRKWLLFYFRKPSLRLPKYSRDALVAAFPEISENNGGEFTLKIFGIAEAKRLAAFIAS